MPHILFLNRSYYPDAEATGQLLTELCEDLSERSNITVIAGQPNRNLDNKPLRRFGMETHHGVNIVRVWNTRLPKRWLLGRAINLLSYFLFSILASLTLKQRPDVIVVETDPPLLCLLGAALRRRYGCQLVVYLQDIYPDLAVAIGKLPRSPLIRWLRKLFFNVYRSADRVVVLSDDMSRLVIESGVDRERVVIIPNWVDCSKVTPVKENNQFRHFHGLENSFVVMYSGNLGLCQGLENVLHAAQLLRKNADVTFLFIGEGSSRLVLEAFAQREHLTNVKFLGYQPLKELSVSLSAADIHLVPLDSRVTRYLFPSKLYGVLASGTPLIAIAETNSDLAQIVISEEVGYVVEPNDPVVLAKTITGLAAHRCHLKIMGHRARALAINRFDRRICTGHFKALLTDLLGEASSATTSSKIITERQMSRMGQKAVDNPL